MVKEEPASLFYVQGKVETNNNGLVTLVPGDAPEGLSLVIASEPLSDNESNWLKVKRNHFIKASRNGEYSEKPISVVDDVNGKFY